jgi:hypothetical protein
VEERVRPPAVADRERVRREEEAGPSRGTSEGGRVGGGGGREGEGKGKGGGEEMGGASLEGDTKRDTVAAVGAAGSTSRPSLAVITSDACWREETELKSEEGRKRRVDRREFRDAVGPDIVRGEVDDWEREGGRGEEKETVP